MTRLASIALAALTLAAIPLHAAHAQSTRPTRAQRAAALRHFQAAEAAKGSGDYASAAREYLAAYDELPRPELLYNTGEVHRLAGDAQHAIEYFQKYLALDPQGRGAQSARAAIDDLTRMLAEQQAQITLVIEEEAARLAATPSPEPAEPVVVAPVEPSPRRGRSLRIAGIATGAAGIVSLGFSVGFGIHAKNLSRKASNLSPDDPNFDDKRRDLNARGRAADRNLVISAAIGVAALGTGITLYVLGRRAAAETPPIALAPVVTPSSFALGASIRF